MKDIDFGYLQITIREGKGGRDRRTMLPVSLVDPLRRQLEKRRIMHEEDLTAGAGYVHLPHALAVKYKNAAREFDWQFVFPAARRSLDPRVEGEEERWCRHHVDETYLQRAVHPVR